MWLVERRAVLVALVVAAIGWVVQVAPASAAISRVQGSPASYSTSTSTTATLPAASTAGTLLVAAAGGTGTTALTAPTGWIRAVRNSATASVTDEIWYYPANPGGITSVTFSGGTGATSVTLGVSEYSGASSSPLSTTGSSQANSGTSLTVGTSASSPAGALGVTSFGHQVNSAQTVTYTPGSGWTNAGNTGSVVSTTHGTSDYRLGLAAGTVSETQTASVSGGWSGVIATFAPATCSGGSLTFASPSTIPFPDVSLNGSDREVTSTVRVTPSDLTGSGSGWRITGTSTALTNGSGRSLPTTATSITAATQSPGSPFCSAATNGVAYPLTLPAGATPPTAVKLFNAAAGTGEGQMHVDLAARLAVPANAYTGTYTSTWTVSTVSGP